MVTFIPEQQLFMKKILAFGASTSRQSINKKLAHWTAQQLSNSSVTLIDLNDFEMPLYSIDKEKENGIPEAAKRFKTLITDHDGIIVSFAEHNGGYAAAFKNVFDWASRLEGSVWADKPMLLMATSPGGRGGASALEIVVKRFPYSGGKVIADFSLPFFNKNFSTEEGIVSETHKNELLDKLSAFSAALQETEVA